MAASLRFARAFGVVSKSRTLLCSSSNQCHAVSVTWLRRKSHAVQFKEFGDPCKVLELVEDPVPDALGAEEVLVKILAAPVNPSDINTIQGTYGIKPQLPAKAGLEGVGEVLKAYTSDIFGVADDLVSVRPGRFPDMRRQGEKCSWSNSTLAPARTFQAIQVADTQFSDFKCNGYTWGHQVGQNVKDLELGNWVLLPGDSWGTWRNFGKGDHKRFRKISNKLDIVTAATMTVNTPTAFRMLSDFETMMPGDTFIQNGANSGVGQAAIQIGKSMGLNSINIVRDRPNLQALKDKLKSLGADYVVTEEELRGPVMKEIFSVVPPPKLALNCIGGKNASDMMRHLARGGTVVTYGGMSKQPLMVSTAALIFQNIRVVGFWRTLWTKQHSHSKADDDMYEYLSKIALEGKLQPPVHSLVPFADYKDAVQMSMEAYAGAKQILVMDERFA